MATSRKRARSQRAASAKLSLNRMLSDVKQPLAIVGGMVIGKFAGDLLDKGINTATTTAGFKGLKGLKGIPTGLVKSLVLIIGGLAAKQMISNPIAKDLGVGMATFGGATLIQNTINLPIKVTTNELPPAAGMGRLGSPAGRQVKPMLPETPNPVNRVQLL